MNMLWLISDTDRSIQALSVLKCLNCHCSCWRCFHPTQQYPLCSSDMNAWIKYVSTYVSVFELPRCKHSPPPPCRAGQRSEVAAQCSRGCLRFSTLLKDTSAACWALTLSSASLITTHHAASEKKHKQRRLSVLPVRASPPIRVGLHLNASSFFCSPPTENTFAGWSRMLPFTYRYIYNMHKCNTHTHGSSILLRDSMNVQSNTAIEQVVPQSQHCHAICHNTIRPTRGSRWCERSHDFSRLGNTIV